MQHVFKHVARAWEGLVRTRTHLGDVDDVRALAGKKGHPPLANAVRSLENDASELFQLGIAHARRLSSRPSDELTPCI